MIKIVKSEDLKRNLHPVGFNGISMVSYNLTDGFIIQSTDLLPGTSVPRFLLHIFNDLKFEAFHCGVRCTIRSLVVNRICVFNRWSRVQEACRFFNYCDITPKKDVIHQQLNSMDNITYVGEKKYSLEMFIRAFEYFARDTYNRLRRGLQLPSISTLTHITSKVKNTYNIYNIYIYIIHIFIKYSRM